MRNRKLFWCGALRMEKILFVICSALALAHAQNATIPVRLVGSNGTQGDVWTYDKVGRVWRPLCDDGWNLRSASVVCMQLNLGPPVSIYSHASSVVSYAYRIAESIEYGIERLVCEGTESNIAECQYSTNSEFGCHHNETAGVVCSSIQIRLVDGMKSTRNGNTRDGRVEVLFDGEWGTICNVGFDMQDADVICRQLGFPGVQRVGSTGEYGNGDADTPIHLGNLQCNGSESEIYQCMGDEEPTGCTHNNDVSVECLPLIRLTDGNTTSSGYLEIFFQEEWYTMCHGYNRQQNAAVVCRELGYKGAVTTSRRPRNTTIHSPVLWYNLYCSANEDSVFDCDKCCGLFYGYSCQHVPEYTCQNLRLVNGDDSSGELEYLSASGWTPVCYTAQFNEHAADVACRQLGFPYANDSGPTTGGGSGIGINSSSCQASYGHYLLDCVEYQEMTCQTRYHLTCYGNPIIRLVGGPVEYMGRVEVYDRESDRWGTICSSDVRNEYYLAHLVCNTFGTSYRTYGPANLSSNIQLSMNSPIVNGPIDCTGDYDYFYQCPSFPLNSTEAMSRCTPDQEWVVVCNSHINLRHSYYSQFRGNGWGAHGFVEIYNDDSHQFGYICDEGWDLNDAHVLCRMLGFPGALDATVRSHYGVPYVTNNALLSNVQCTGTENSIYDCPSDPNPSCDRTRSAGVRCLATRLVDGPNQYSGRVEVFNSDSHRNYGNYRAFALQWGTLCDSEWNANDANVVCHSLGYQATEATAHAGGTYGTGEGPIWGNRVICVGTEFYIPDCWIYNRYGYSSGPICNHTTDVGVTCLAPLPVRLQGSPHASVGRLEIWRNDMWGSVCNEDFTIEAANVVCRQLGYDQALDYTPGGYFGQSTGPIHMSNVMCTGDETTITDCTFTTTHSCDHSQDVGIYCQDIRLNEAGFLEANEDSGWGPVCSNYFDTNAAMVACRQLRLGLPVSYNRNTTLANQTYYFTYLRCNGNEQRLTECRAYNYYSTCNTTYLQCSDVRLEDDAGNFSGRVEVLYNGEWGTVCSDEFDENDAAVVCRQAGHGPPVRYWTDPSHSRHGRIWLDDLQCDGTEDTLSECQSNNWGDTNCDHTQDVFIECADFCNQNIDTTGKYFTAVYETTPSYTYTTATLRCIEGYVLITAGSAICGSDGQWIIEYPDCIVPVRLIDESGDVRPVFTGGVQDTSRGRVELLVNRVWHTVCSQGFGFKEANVICNQLGLNGARTVRTGYYGEGTGGIVALRNRGCDGGEGSFIDCDLSSTLDCSHKDDVGIECIDIRLVPMDYNRPYSGRLEVFFNNEWGQVCNTAFNLSEVTVVCSQIGYATLESETFSTSLPANSPIWIQNINCLSTENTLLDCPSDVEYHVGKITEPCYEAIGVTCLLYSFDEAGVCRPFLPPENGYYVNDIRQSYFANSSMNSIQISCKEGYRLLERDNTGNYSDYVNSNGIAICEDYGFWDVEFYCLDIIAITVSFEETWYRVDENNGSVQLVLALSRSSLDNITVHMASSRDGETKVYTVIFSAGETTVSFDVEIIDDDWIENDEIIQFMILQDLLPNGVNIGVPNMATVIIIDDAEDMVLPFLSFSNEARQLRRYLDGVSDAIYIPFEIPFGFQTHKTAYVGTNGVISFSRPFYYSYPSVFPGYYYLRRFFVVAPYWADHDIRRDGNVFYETFERGRSRNDDNVLDIVNRYLELNNLAQNFSGTFMILAEWQNVHPYPHGSGYFYYFERYYPSIRAFTNQENTYQALVITDGKDSYTVFTYMCDLMQWSGLWRYPTIGYNAGGALFANHPLTAREEADQIDCINNSSQYINVVYKISTDPDIIRQLQAQCQSWYFSDIELHGSSENISAFSESQVACPCTSLQAWWDRRFRYFTRKDDSFCFIERFANTLGGAQECCYSRSSQMFGALVLQGRSSGGLLRYHPWWSWTVNHPNYLEHDSNPQVICCLAAVGYCNLYHERRPPRNCEGYVPQRRARGWGDPHITTVDGRIYTFNGLGEYVLLRENANDFEFQGRTVLAPNSNATIFSAYVVKDGSAIVEVSTNPTTGLFTIKQDGTDVSDSLTSIGDNVTAPSAFIERSSNNSITVSFPSGVGITINYTAGLLVHTLEVPSSFEGTTSGLLGNYNNDDSDEFVFRNGTMISNSSSDRDIHQFGQSWQITEQESIFTYESGQSVNTFFVPEHMPPFLDEVLSSLMVNSTLTDVCGGNVECLFDFDQTGDVEVGMATMAVENEAATEMQEAFSFPPNITAPKTFMATVGEESVYTFTVTSDSQSIIVIILHEGEETLPSGVQLNNPDGDSYTITWIPSDNTSVLNLTIVAMDPSLENITSFFNPVVQLCACENGGNCTTDGLLTNDFSFVILNCECPEGYDGEFCQNDADGCDIVSCLEGQQCFDYPAPLVGAECACPGGYASSNDSKCIDIDECANRSTIDCTQQCINTPGSYECDCYDGYRAITANATQCKDINECEGYNDCHQMCTNTDGSYYCSCNTGFVLAADNKTCGADVLCTVSNCSQGCANINGIETCFCMPGYQLNIDHVTCSDINECAENGTCGQDCTNTDGSFMCSCYNGYELDESGRSCNDIDECLSGPCPPHLICDNVDGNYNCDCPDGTVKNGTDCILIPIVMPSRLFTNPTSTITAELTPTVTSTVTSTPDYRESFDELSVGAVIGIIAGVIVFIFAVVLILCIVARRVYLKFWPKEDHLIKKKQDNLSLDPMSSSNETINY